MSKRTRYINEIIIHCSATAEGRDFRAHDIDEWHRDLGWDEIGYHYVIDLDGKIEQGRNVEKVGAHCKNHNAYSIGVCYIGGCAADGKTPKDTRTPEQIAALKQLIRQLRKEHRDIVKVSGHSWYNSKKRCPCFDVYNFVKQMDNE